MFYLTSLTMLLLHSVYAKETMMMRDCSEYNEWCRKIQKSRQYTRNNNNNNNTENETSEWAYQGIILFVQFLLCLGILLCAVLLFFVLFLLWLLRVYHFQWWNSCHPYWLFLYIVIFEVIFGWMWKTFYLWGLIVF